MKEKVWRTETLAQALADGDIVPLPVAAWERVAADFPVVEDHETGLAGHLLLVRRPVPGRKSAGWAIVEQPKPAERVVRPLASAAEARALIADRLAAYERMWDG
jgi:hypothetical protein